MYRDKKISVVIPCYDEEKGIEMVLHNIPAGLGLIPREDYISWRKVTYNQVFVVPSLIGEQVKFYFTNRTGYKEMLEEREAQQRKSGVQR